MVNQRTLLLNTLSGTALYVINIAVAFFLSPILLKALGNNAYGLWEMIMSVIGYMGLLDLGIGSAMVRYVAVADGGGSREEMARIMATALAFFVSMGLLASTVFGFLGFYPTMIGGKEALSIAGVELLFYIFAVNALFLFPMQVFLSVLLGIQRHYFINCARILLNCVKAIITYWYLTSHVDNPLVFISIAELIYTLLSFIIFYKFLFFKEEIPRFSYRSVSKKTFFDLFVFGSKNLVMMAASRLQNQSVPIIIAHVVGMGSIVNYTFPNRLVDYAKGLSLAVGYPLTPYFSAIFGKSQTEELRRSWLKTTFVLQGIMFIMPIVLWQYGEVFLRLWIGLEYAEAGHWVIRLLVVGLVADTLAVNSFRLLTAKASHGKSALVWLVLGILSIPGGVVAGKMWGIEGVTFAVVLASVVGNIATVALTCSSLDISPGEFFRATCLKLLGPIALGYGCSIFLLHLWEIESYVSLLSNTAIVCLFYFLNVWLIALEKSEKLSIIEKVLGRFTNK